MGTNVRKTEVAAGPQGEFATESTRGKAPAALVSLVTAIKRARANPTPGRIHELRIAVRRLEASIGLAGHSAPSLPVGEVTRFARIAGALRDLDVTAAWLAGACRPDPVPTGLAGRLRRARRRQMAAVTRRLGNRRSERALARLRSGPPLPIDAGSDPSVRRSTAALLRHAAWRRPVLESIEAVVADPAAIEAHHDLRRHLRLYRHAARVANPDTPPEIGFAAAQSALARLHDLATIARRLARLAGGADRLPGRVAEALAVDWRRGRRVWNEIALETTAPGGPK